MRTLLLDRTTWDLCLDASGNVAVASEPYALLQNVATTARLFRGELWYDTRQGLPYFEQVLGHAPSRQFLRNLYERAARLVVGVVVARCYFTGFEKRQLRGQLQVTDANGVTHAVGF